MQKIVPHVWFDHEAEEAARYYLSLFRGSKIRGVTRYGKEGFAIHGQPEGRVMTVDFELGGYRLVAINGGPHFTPTPAVSFFVMLESEPEVDALWAGLLDGGSELMPLRAYEWSARYGWLNDRYGVSWQIALGRRRDVGQTITPSLLFTGPQHGRAEEAIELYCSLFPGSRVEAILRHDGSEGETAGTVKHARFTLGGETFMAMDSAQPHGFGFTEAVSLMVRCETQAEIDHFWEALSAVPEAEQCGWLKDRFGLSWQIVPSLLPAMLMDPDAEKSQRVTKAFLAMRKFDIEALQRAYAGVA